MFNASLIRTASLPKFTPSSWEFTTSGGAEFDALIFAAGSGSFFVVNGDDPDGIVHELLFVGAGLTTSKGPIPFGIGGSFSTPEMPSSGVGPIMQKAGHKLKTSDFGGSGLILTAAGGAIKGKGYSIILFGIPPFTVAAGRMEGVTYIGPGGGFTALACIFTVDP